MNVSEAELAIFEKPIHMETLQELEYHQESFLCAIKNCISFIKSLGLIEFW